MQTLLQKIKFFISMYRWILLLLVPFLLFLLFLPLLFINNQPQQKTSSPTEIPIPTQSTQNPGQQNVQKLPEQGDTDDHLEEFVVQDKLLQTQKANNETTISTYYSGVPERPDLVIKSVDGQQIFSRTVNTPNFQLSSLSTYTSIYGNPEKVVSGSSFYGSDYAIYIYGSNGLALIVQAQNGRVSEEHRFTPMNADEYLKEFSNQN